MLVARAVSALAMLVARAVSALAMLVARAVSALAMLAACAVLAVAAAVPGPAMAAPAQRVSLLTVESEVMCPSCHEPLQAVSSPQALYEKAYIKKLIGEGDTNQQILNQLVAQFGVSVLAKPPASGFNLLIYVLPPLVLVLGALFLLVTLPRWRRRSLAAAGSPLGAPPPVSAADGKRIDEDLARLV